jgi:hypothetical protein
MLQSHHIRVAFANSKRPQHLSCSGKAFFLLERFIVLVHVSQALLGQLARLNWPQNVDKLSISVIDEPEAAAYYSCNMVRESQVRAHMEPRELVQYWVDAFNRLDVDALADLYSEDATNHQVAEAPVVGRIAIREMFAMGFAKAKMVCIVEHIFQEGEWAILEWRDPVGLRGCGFFHIVNGKIVFQRGYWDKLTFLRLQGLPMPEAP